MLEAKITGDIYWELLIVHQLFDKINGKNDTKWSY